jgi:hypothetical protein
VELEVSKTIEQVTNLGIDDLGVVTVGKDIQKSLIRSEIESGEDLLLLGEILRKSSLAKVNLDDSVVKELLSALSGAATNDILLFGGISEHFLESSINTLESLGILRELMLDILGTNEDGLKSLPVLLYLHPGDDDGIDSLDVLELLLDSVTELFDVLG